MLALFVAIVESPLALGKENAPLFSLKRSVSLLFLPPALGGGLLKGVLFSRQDKLWTTILL
jgi:hypothetical protein